MPSQTFLNLPTEKQQKITLALLHEFANYPLAQAQVSRIVKKAQIARGAFYKYFTDLNDAYLYLYKVAMQEIHTNLKHAPKDSNSPDALSKFYLSEIKNFLNESQTSSYADFIKMHLLENEISLRSLQAPEPETDAIKWSIAVLSHQTIRDCYRYPAQQEVILARVSPIIQAILQQA